jgi:hypothetical protein
MIHCRPEIRAPRLAVFWGYAPQGRDLQLLGYSVPAEEVPLVAGFRTIEQGHVDLWRQVRSGVPQLRRAEYDEVARGRVNWREEDKAFLVLLDRRLMPRSFVTRLIDQLCLADQNVLVMSDSHYR